MTSLDQSSFAVPNESKPSVPRYYSQLKKAHKERVIPELMEEDIEESFVRGAGSSVFAVPYALLMLLLSAHRKWSRWTVREQDREQRPATAQAYRDSSLVPGNAFVETE